MARRVSRGAPRADDARGAPGAGTVEENSAASGYSDAVERGLAREERYARQTLFTGIGRAGQERLGRARALIVGCGATGSVVANKLARAGAGHLRIADRDYVDGN